MRRAGCAGLVAAAQPLRWRRDERAVRRVRRRRRRLVRRRPISAPATWSVTCSPMRMDKQIEQAAAAVVPVPPTVLRRQSARAALTRSLARGRAATRRRRDLTSAYPPEVHYRGMLRSQELSPGMLAAVVLTDPRGADCASRRPPRRTASTCYGRRRRRRRGRRRTAPSQHQVELTRHRSHLAISCCV